MCGRFSLSKSDQDVADLFRVPKMPELAARYNIAPSQPIVAVLSEARDRQLRHLVWGLVPPWAKAPARSRGMINARSETAAIKPMFRHAFKHRRCLIAADGFFEWQKVAGGKQPHFIALTGQKLFAFAGLWEHWEGADGSEIYSCAILTTEPNALCATIHDRMPVILPPQAYERWLDPTVQDAKQLQPLLTPYPAEKMIAHPVSRYVNSPRHDDAKCMAPSEEQGSLW
jgi:putative SOS response-associated peptidase YedK